MDLALAALHTVLVAAIAVDDLEVVVVAVSDSETRALSLRGDPVHGLPVSWSSEKASSVGVSSLRGSTPSRLRTSFVSTVPTCGTGS